MVIPLIYDDTVLDTRAAFDAHGGLSGQHILIQGVEQEQLTAPNEANATYDLRVGPEYRYLHTNEKRELSSQGDEEKIILRRGESALILTEEHIQLPKSVFGVVVTKVAFVQQGAANPPSKVDPGYSGPLIVTVTNSARDPVILTKGQRFCSIFFLRVEGEAKPYNKPAKRIIGSGEKARKRSVREHVDTHSTTIVIVNLILTVLLILATAYLWVNS